MVTIGTSITAPNPPPLFIFLLAPEEVLSYPAPPYSTVCRCGPIDISYFGRLSTGQKKN